MPLLVPSGPEYLWSAQSSTAQPAANYGTAIVPGNNTYGTYTQVMSSATLSEDCWWIRINVNSNNVAAALRDTLLTIGVDPAGGSSYVDTLKHLLVSDAQNYNLGGGGVWYDFPFFIAAGSSIAAKASVNNATVGTLRVFIQVWGRPKYPEITRVGRIFRTFGEVTASSRGTVITPGTTNEGGWTQLGSATAERLWYWEMGYGCGDATMNAKLTHADIGVGDASNKRVIILDTHIVTTNAETIVKLPNGMFADVAEGDLVYGRSQGSAAADTDENMIAYGVGG